MPITACRIPRPRAGKAAHKFGGNRNGRGPQRNKQNTVVGLIKRVQQLNIHGRANDHKENRGEKVRNRPKLGFNQTRPVRASQHQPSGKRPDNR